jgi:hypothetical protein
MAFSITRPETAGGTMQQATLSSTQGLAAFKEWAVSCDALGQGKQVMIFRKGGIKEKGHVFKMEHPHFFLYPTFEHQDSESIKADYQPLLASALAAKPELGEVSIHYWAQVDEAWALNSMEPVLAQKDNHIYSDQSVKDRWEWAPAKPLWLLLLRVYKLQTPLNLEVLEEYTGCKSWIDLAQLPASASGLPCSPVLDDAAYAAMAAKVRSLVPGA